MTKYLSLVLTILFTAITYSGLYSQNSLPFGDISPADLSGKPYLHDPGADAVILSDVGVATLNYVNEFYVELERDIRIRIVNSNGFDYADIEIPYSAGDDLISFRASTFNIKDGQKIETKIDKKSFIRENISSTGKVLKFNFPDVHEGSVIEYSYIIRYRNDALYTFVPWEFQSEIPVAYSLLTVSYPEPCTYKFVITGNPGSVSTKTAVSEATFFGQRTKVITRSWSATNLPAFREEPYIKSSYEHLTRLTFELASISFPGSSYNEITPTYLTLTEKLLDRTDFGKALTTDFKSVAEKIVKDQTSDYSKVKMIHEYVSSNILWNGENDYTASAPLRTIMKKGKGNSADVNLLLIALLRSAGMKADPVILSTRSHGSLNQLSAMIQQFNYLVAYVSVDGNFILVDATDPVRPYNILPLNCLNDAGRLITVYDSRFVDLTNGEKLIKTQEIYVSLGTSGNLEGTMKSTSSSYSAVSIRKSIKLEGKDGYIDLVKSNAGNIEISDYKIVNAEDRYSELIETCNIEFRDAAQKAGDELLLNSNFSLTQPRNPFSEPGRKFPVDFGCPVDEKYTLNLKIPEGYEVTEKPADLSLSLGKGYGLYDFKCSVNGNEMIIKTIFKIDKTVMQPSEYTQLREFYSEIVKKQSELVVMRKNSAL